MMSSNLIYPLTFDPVFQDYIWGGRHLETVLGRQLPPGIIAESWEISGHSTSPTRANNGPLKGKTLPEILSLLGLSLVGTRSEDMLARGKFPLLVKLLDANKPLSVQVHPPDEYARVHENGELGKTEMWYILHANPDARLIYGLKPGVTPQIFREELEAGTLETCLHQLPVKAGDAVYIPAGSVHAVLEGIVLAEIQQSSNTTYRVYDWNRVGADGKPRPLHVEKALDVINFDQVEPGPYQPEIIEQENGFERTIISRSPYFVVEKVTLTSANPSFTGYCDGTTFEIWGTMSGHIQVKCDDAQLDLPAVHFSLLPAALGAFEISAKGPSELLRVYVPERN
jgi:mannose-6-phosphate isomerase